MVSKLARCLILAWLTLVFGADTARADEEPGWATSVGDTPLPPLPGGTGWQRVASFGGGSDSTCIGHPKTPLCAVETLNAGRVRGDIELANIASARSGHYKPGSFSRRSQPTLYHYRVIYDGPANCKLAFRMATLRGCYPTGRMIVLQQQTCIIHWVGQDWSCNSEDPEALTFFFLRRAGTLWEVVYFLDAFY